MNHIAIDLGGVDSQVCIRNARGALVEERKVKTSKLGTLLRKQPASRVVLETCAEAFGLADDFRAQGHDVRIVPSTLAPALGVGARKTKTDVRDARALSDASCRLELPSVHLPSRTSRERKALCTARESLVSARTQLINSARGYLRSLGQRPRRGATSSFPRRVRELLGEHPEGLPAFVERQLRCIDELSVQIADADQELKTLSKSDPLLVRLMTTPGVGPVTAIRFSAAIDDTSRFESAAKVGAYLGLTPGERSSGTRQHRTSITKAGAPRVRRVLAQAAHTALRCAKKDPMVEWAHEVEKRRGKPVAVIALSRKIAGILYAMMRDGTRYRAEIAARSVA